MGFTCAFKHPPWMFENSPATRQTGESCFINSEIVGIQENFPEATNRQDTHFSNFNPLLTFDREKQPQSIYLKWRL